MSAKHFINDPNYLVDRALQGLTISNPSIALDLENKVIYTRPGRYDNQRVSIISGGGSGHEPSFGGFVGDGLLSAAVSGTIFASPSSKQILTAIRSRVDTARGVLVIVMNYTGDVLNFGLAVEKAKAEGINVEMLVVGDDVGVGRARSGKVGRRGIAGTVLVHKIAGALAATGASLDEVYRVARLTAENLVSVGASLDHVHVPGRAPPDPNSNEALQYGEVEIGMGIHNEPGSARAVASLQDLVSKMLSQLLDRHDTDRSYIHVNSNEAVIMINNLGGVSVLEFGAITAEVMEQIERKYYIKPARILSGTYMTSLNGLGFSISILNVTNTHGGLGMVSLLDYPSEAAGWVAPVRKDTWEQKSNQTRNGSGGIIREYRNSGLRMEPESVRATLITALQRVVAAEPAITKYDTIVGDGDCGIGLKRGAEAILALISQSEFTGDIVLLLEKIVQVVEKVMDGTSGALYAIYLNAMLLALRQHSGEATKAVWAGAMSEAAKKLAKYTPAQPGDRTLIDALNPFIETLKATDSLMQAAEASREGAERTKGMEASLGRAVYVGGLGFQEVPDPGAWGLSEFFLGLTDVSVPVDSSSAILSEVATPPALAQPDIWSAVPQPGQPSVPQHAWSPLPSTIYTPSATTQSHLTASEAPSSSNGDYYYPTPDVSVSTLSISGIDSSDTEPEYEVL